MGETETRFKALALGEGISLATGLIEGLSGRGHLDSTLVERVPTETVEAISQIYLELGGDESLLASKRASSLRLDFLLPRERCLVEIDEIQHFTSARSKTFDHYPSNVELLFDPEGYQALVRRWKLKADGYRRAKTAVDFAFPGGRQAQRAYFDALRDLAAPFLFGSVLRVPVPECSGDIAFQRFLTALE